MPSPWHRSTKDHRGKPVPIPSGLTVAAVAADSRLSPRARERITAHLRRDELSWAESAQGCAWEFAVQFLLVPIAVVVVLCWWWFIARGWSKQAVKWSIVAVSIAVFVAYISLDIWVKRACRGTVIEALLREGLCPSCGYEIKTVPPQADGCSVCPECGAAWRLALPGQPTDPEARSPWHGTDTTSGKAPPAPS